MSKRNIFIIMKRETMKMIGAIGFTISVLTIYSFLNYFYEKNRLIAQIDKQLYSAAVAVPFVLINDFHDRTITSTSISLDEDNQNIKNLSKLNDQLGTKFLYTVIRDNNGQYRITSSSALTSEIKENKEVHYFMPYPDASDTLKTSFEHPSINFIKPNKIYKALYVPIFSDRWGTYRSIILPIATLKGNLYIVGVDMDISYVNNILKENTLKTLLSFLLFLIAIIPIVMTYNSMLKRKHEEYQEVHKLYIDHSKLSTTDSLTQLYNRYKIDNELQIQYKNLQRGGNPFALLILDLDYFKNINDQYGHQVGDEVLKLFANILKEHSKSTDIVGRWGGEEFMIIYPDSDLNKGFDLAEKLRLAVNESKETLRYNLTVSIGVGAGVYENNITLTQLLKSVDEALYQAKKMGRNQTRKVR